MVFDGNLFAERIRKRLLEEGKLAGKKLLIFQTGKDEDVYVKLKRKAGESLGVKVEVIKGKIDFMTSEVEEADGIMIQLPIVGVSGEERDEILKRIPLNKDVDGLSPLGGKFLPAAVVAVEKILKMQSTKGRRIGRTVAVVGCKGFVGKVLTRRLEAKGFDVGDDLNKLTNFDVVIGVTGQEGLMKPDMVKKGVVAIDLGYPKADFDEKVKKKALFFTPVPGGVGPVTVMSLFENLSRT